MWVTHSEREEVRRQQDLALVAAAQEADARFRATHRALEALLDDPNAVPHLARHGILRATWGRSMRLPGNGRVEGLAVLEGIVLRGVISALLEDAPLVRWLSRHHPTQLVVLHEVGSATAG
jgi:hypothetical protein